MASFYVMENFTTPADAQLRFLPPGGVYIAGDTINGLTAAEAGELLLMAPAGTFQPTDEAGKTVDQWAARRRAPIEVNLSGSLTPSSDVGTK